MLHLIAPNITIEQIRANIRKYHAEGFSLLSNQDAANIVLAYKRAIAKKNLIKLSEFDKWFKGDFQTYLGKYLNEEGNLIEEKGLEYAIREVVNENIPRSKKDRKNGSEGLVQSHRRITKLAQSKGLKFASIELLNILGEKTQKRILKRINANEDRFNDVSTDADNGEFTIKLPVSNIDSTQYIDWFDLTSEGKTGKNIQEGIAKGELNIEELKAQFISSLETYLAQKSLPLSSAIITQILTKVIETDPMAPYVGANEKDITGLLGEIQALCYLALLCGDSFQLNEQNVQWAAHQTDMGKKYHADIVFKEAYGIQVKNTTKEIIDEVSFNSASLDHVLNAMCTEGYVTPEEKDVIIDVYTTYYFNQPYQNVDGTLVLSSNEEYAPTDDLVESFVRIADKMLSYLFDYFMYIGVGNAARNERGNLLYFLGGNSVVLASEICSAILAQIDELEDFVLNKPERESSEIENIVSFTNNKNLLKDKDDKTFIANVSNKVGATLHKAVSSKIVLGSSYDFSNLIAHLYE